MGLPRVQEGTPCHRLLFGWTVETHLLKFLLILIPETCDAHTLSLTVTLFFRPSSYYVMSFLQSSCVGLLHPGALVLEALGKSSPDFPGGPGVGGPIYL